MRKAGARPREALVEAMGVAISAITALGTLVVSSSIADTARWFNRYDERCRSGCASSSV
jgi:hypothetical protein